MDESSKIFVITLGDVRNPVDDLGQVHSIGALPSSPFEVISNANESVNEGQDRTVSMVADASTSATVENTVVTSVGRHDGLLSPVLAIQHKDKLNVGPLQPVRSQLVLQQFFDISYIFCTSPTSHLGDWKYLRLIRKISFWILVILSCFDSVVSMNGTYMKEGTKDFHRYTEMGFHVVNMVCKMYHAKVLMAIEAKLDIVSRLLCTLDECFFRMMPLIRQQPMELPRYNSLVVLVGVVPMVAAGFWGVFGFWPLKDWSWERILYFGAIDVGRTFVVWEKGMEEAGNNKTEQLLFVYTPDAAWIALGSLRLCGKVAAQMERFAMCNVMVALAVSLFKHTKPMIRVFKLLECRLALGVADAQVKYDDSQFEEAWKYYFRLRKTSVEMNRAFGGLIRCAHITNTFSFLFILVVTVFSEHTVVTFVLFTYEVMLVLIFYTLATKVNQVNEMARKWIKDNTIHTSPIEVNTRTLHVLLDDIKQAPIGLGSGSFLVDGGLIQRVLGLLASLLAFMVEAEADAVGSA